MVKAVKTNDRRKRRSRIFLTLREVLSRSISAYTARRNFSERQRVQKLHLFKKRAAATSAVHPSFTASIFNGKMHNKRLKDGRNMARVGSYKAGDWKTVDGYGS